MVEVRGRGGMGARVRKEIRGGKDMCSGDQEVGSTGMVRDGRGVGQGLGVVWHIVVIWHVVEDIARVGEGVRGTIVGGMR